MAFVIHIYYADMGLIILDKIHKLPLEYDVFITTSSELVAGSAYSACADYSFRGDHNIVIVPNIGRNFAPFLVEFGNILNKYDLICHLHTKKSLHTKTFSGWGQYLLENLVGSPNLVASIIERFEEEPDCGLVYPRRYSALPDWSEAWLGNFTIAKNWCVVNDISIKSGQVYFPTGGMFWARSQAIRQLLSFDWAYSNFPEEFGQIDGTMQHSIERLVGAVTRFNGFYHRVYDPCSGDFETIFSI